MNVIKELMLEEISACTNPAQDKALFKITKNKKEESNVQETVRKYIELESKLRDAEQNGTIMKAGITKANAEAALDELAQSLQARDGGSAEANFAKAMTEYPMLGSLALGMTTD